MATIATTVELPRRVPPARQGAAPTGIRSQTLDFARGAAHTRLKKMTAFGLLEASINPTHAGGAIEASLRAWILARIAFDGTHRWPFSILFGVSLIRLTSRLQAFGRTDPADACFHRVLWLIPFGTSRGLQRCRTRAE